LTVQEAISPQEAASTNQPVNAVVDVGAAVSCTPVPVGNREAHADGQLIPDGDDITLPVPSVVTLMSGISENVAEAPLVPSTVIVHVVLVPHETGTLPPHPPNSDWAAGAEVNVTDVPSLYTALQFEVHTTSAVEDAESVTVPWPPPEKDTFTACVGNLLNVAMTFTGPLVMVIAHVALDPHVGGASPPQPPKRLSPVGVAVSATVPALNVALQGLGL
jgi:hypothetical protein